MPRVSDATHPAVLRELDSITVRSPSSGGFRWLQDGNITGISKRGEQDHCTILPKAERNLWKSEILKDTSREAISHGAPSNCIYFFLLALSSSAHSYVGQVLHPTLISFKLPSNELAEILILCPKRCNINLYQRKDQIEVQSTPRGYPVVLSLRIMIFISFASSVLRHFCLRTLKAPSTTQTSVHGELHQPSSCSPASKANATVLL